jgi:hypothetical protein
MAQGTSFDREKEFAGLDFHSVRPEERFIRTMETLIQQPDKSIRKQVNTGLKPSGLPDAGERKL